MSHWIKVHNNNLGSSHLIFCFIHPPLLWFICVFLVVSDSAYLQGIFYHFTSLTYYSREAQSLADSPWQFVEIEVRGNVFLYATSYLHNKN